MFSNVMHNICRFLRKQQLFSLNQMWVWRTYRAQTYRWTAVMWIMLQGQFERFLTDILSLCFCYVNVSPQESSAAEIHSSRPQLLLLFFVEGETKASGCWKYQFCIRVSLSGTRRSETPTAEPKLGWLKCDWAPLLHVILLSAHTSCLPLYGTPAVEEVVRSLSRSSTAQKLLCVWNFHLCRRHPSMHRGVQMSSGQISSQEYTRHHHVPTDFICLKSSTRAHTFRFCPRLSGYWSSISDKDK